MEFFRPIRFQRYDIKFKTKIVFPQLQIFPQFFLIIAKRNHIRNMALDDII